MTHLSPDLFWQALRKALQNSEKYSDAEKWEAYRSDSLWTKVAIAAAESACHDLDLLTQREYFKVDLIGYTRRQNEIVKFKGYNWDLKVALEHENNSVHWRDELCKLTHLVADLCVLISYYGPDESVEEELTEAFEVMGNRMNRVPGREWLFVFGPNIAACEADKNASFRVFALGKNNEPIALLDAEKLTPTDWQYT